MQKRELPAVPLVDAGHAVAGHHPLQLQPDALPPGAVSTRISRRGGVSGFSPCHSLTSSITKTQALSLGVA